MEKLISFQRLIFFLIFFVMTEFSFGKTGIIKGVVIDEGTGDPMIGARISVENQKFGALTKINGDFIIQNIPEGVYTIKINYVGYQTITINDVVVKSNQVTTLDVSMRQADLMQKEIIITADAIKTTGAALLKERQKAEAVSDAIGAEEISRVGGGNAADAIKKVTGATTEGGKYVYIRGLGDRYSSTQLNGVNLPSADPDKKSVHFDMFPSNMIENIVTIKTATPDKPGDFTGGTVNISTKKFPEKLTINSSISTSYNDLTTGKTFLTYPGGSLDWLGFDDGTRAVPEIVKNNAIPTVTEARSKNKPESVAKAELLDKQSKAFSPIFAPTNDIAPLNSNFSVSMGNQHHINTQALGYFFSFGYGRSFSSFTNGVVGQYVQSGKLSEELTTEYMSKLNSSEVEVSWGTVANLSYNFNSNNRVGFNYLYSRNAQNEASYQEGWIKTYNANTQTRVLNYNERGMSSYQLKGEHNFASLGGVKLDWNLGISYNIQNQPDYRTFDNEYEVLSNGTVKYLLNPNDNNALPSRYYRDLYEDMNSFDFNIEIPIKNLLDNPVKLKTGFLFNDRNRVFAEKRYVYRQDGDDIVYTGDPNSFMADSTGIRVWKSQGNFNYFGTYLEDRTQLSGSYTGWEQVIASYLMVDLFLFDNIRLVGGVRYETTKIHTKSKDPLRNEGNIEENDLLPSVNFIYQIMQNMNLRLAYGKTIAKPNFREIAPYDSYLPIQKVVFLGNAELQRTVIDNFDLRWEWFSNPGEILSVGLFYKDFTNPIELVIKNEHNNIRPENVDKAYLYGAEFEFRKDLDFISFLKNFYLGMNLTLVQSQVDLSEYEYQHRKAYDQNASNVRQLQGQSPYVVNVDLSYLNNDWGTEASLNFNVFGKRLTKVGFGTPDYYEFPKPDLNLIIGQKLFDSIKIKFSAKNILNSHYYEATTFKGVDYIANERFMGRSYSISIGYYFE